MLARLNTQGHTLTLPLVGEDSGGEDDECAVVLDLVTRYEIPSWMSCSHYHIASLIQSKYMIVSN